MRLSRATVGAVSPAVARPAAAPGATRRIVHLGIGAFHRAHQAVYTQDAGDGWRITGVSLRSPHVRDTLNPQDGLYTVTERSNGATATRLITVVETVLVATEDPAAVIAVLAAPDTHVVTLTVTEKGYYRHPASGDLRTEDPAIVADLGGAAPQTIYGFLAAALDRRRVEGAGGLTLVSCDNLSGNGTLLLRLLLAFLQLQDPGLAAWARVNLAAPDTMVDRIVPASTAADRAMVAAAIGVADEAAIVTEPFRQWVIEDRFVGPRPRWEAAGAQIVRDVGPFELAKLRLLNASHSTLAYIGLQLGYRFVHEAIADPLLRDFVMAQAIEESVPTLPAAAGLDPAGYVAAILERFGNADLHHRLDQIAMDGSQKLPQRWLATVADRLARGMDSRRLLVSIAAWIAYAANAPDIADDPLSARYAAIWRDSAGDRARATGRFVADLGLFDPVLCDSPTFVSALQAAVLAWTQQGPRAVLGAAGRMNAGE